MIHRQNVNRDVSRVQLVAEKRQECQKLGTCISVDYHYNLLDVHFCSKVHTSSCVTATQYINFKTTRNAIISINKYQEHDDFIFTVGLLTL